MKRGIASSIIFLILFIIFIGIFIYISQVGGPRLQYRLRFQFQSFIWVRIVKSLYMKLPKPLRFLFPISINLQERLKIIEKGYVNMRGRENETGEYLFKNAKLTWEALHLGFPVLKQQKSNTLTTFITSFKTDRTIDADEVMNYINKTKYQENKDLKIGLITNSSSGLAKPYPPADALPKNFTAEIVYSEWTLERNPRGTFKCASKEVEACYMPLEERKNSFSSDEQYYMKKGLFQVLSERRASWEPNPEDVGGWIDSYFCEIGDVEDLASIFQTVALVTPIAPVVQWGIESLEEWSKVDAPCPYYKTSCGYINKSLACCEDKIFICIRS